MWHCWPSMWVHRHPWATGCRTAPFHFSPDLFIKTAATPNPECLKFYSIDLIFLAEGCVCMPGSCTVYAVRHCHTALYQGTVIPCQVENLSIICSRSLTFILMCVVGWDAPCSVTGANTFVPISPVNVNKGKRLFILMANFEVWFKVWTGNKHVDYRSRMNTGMG